MIRETLGGSRSGYCQLRVVQSLSVRLSERNGLGMLAGFVKS